MGWGLPAAMGLALAGTDERVVSVSGDGSFWMVAQDLETCVREDIPVVNVVVNNNAYGNTRDRQRSRTRAATSGCSTATPTWPGSRRRWAAGVRVERDDELRPSPRRWPRTGIDVIQDPLYGLPPGLEPPATR